jgi:hydroxypyruvate reductase
MEAAAARRDLTETFRAALAAVGGREAVRRALMRGAPEPPITLVAIGKAAQSMALGALDALGGRVRGGLVIGKAGHLDPARLAAAGLEAVEGGHPLPSPGSLEAGRRLLSLIGGADDATLLFLLSGGASSLVEVPVAGLGPAELARAGGWLLGSGLDIRRTNQVRKALSLIKGGGLLRWLGGRRAEALAISDVVGDDPAVIGSGLLVPEPGLGRAVSGLGLPDWLHGWVDRGLAARGSLPERGVEVRIVADVGLAKGAAEREAQRRGYRVFGHRDLVGGGAAAAGRRLAGALRDGAPGFHVWGGETTVVLPPSPGRGGRNQHLALAAATEIAGHRDCLFLSAGTDGTDGPTDDAGALVDGETCARAAAAGLDPHAALAGADAGTLLAATGDLIRTGPTGTNVMDLMLGLKLGGGG